MFYSAECTSNDIKLSYSSLSCSHSQSMILGKQILLSNLKQKIKFRKNIFLFNIMDFFSFKNCMKNFSDSGMIYFCSKIK